MTNQVVPTEEILASKFINTRLDRFKKLSVRVRKLVLEVAQYYLSVIYPLDADASQICRDIDYAKRENDEPLLVESYKNFLAFLPVKFRAKVEGGFLFRQPTKHDLVDAHFYVNHLDTMKEFNQQFLGPDEFGATMQDQLRMLEFALQQNNNNSDGPSI